MRPIPTAILAAGLVGSLAIWTYHFRRVDHHQTVQNSVTSGSTAALREVLEAGFDPDTRLDTRDNYERHPPLTLAAVSGNVEAMRVLLEHGADPLVLDRRGRTPLTAVAEGHQPEALALLIEAAGGREALGDEILASALVEATANGAVDCVDVLLDTGMDVNARGRQGSSAMHAAVASRSHERSFERILAAGGDVNARSSRDETPLLACLRTMRREAKASAFEPRIERLIAAGADVNVVAPDGETALGSALEVSDGVVAMLLHAGADPNRRLRHGSMPLHEAIRDASPKLVRMLLDAGADPAEVDGRYFMQERTALEIAEAGASSNGNSKNQDAQDILAMIREALGMPLLPVDQGDDEAERDTDG